MVRYAAASVFGRWYTAPSPLFITSSVEKNTPASSLAEVIRQATRLRKLYLRMSYNTIQESFLEHFPPLADAIAALPSLDDVFIYDANASALQLLSCMKSHPRHHITLYHPQNIRGSGNGLPMNALDNTMLSLLTFVDSLVTLSLDGHHIFSRTLKADSVWPALHELNLCSTTIDLTSISTACPNLHTLHIDRCKLTNPHASLHLPKLDFLEVDYSLPLSTRVRRLYLVNSKANITSKIESMLQQANPVVLTCYLTMANTMAIAKVCPDLQDLRVVVPQERGLVDVLKILCPLRETPIQSIMFQTGRLTTCTMEPFALQVAALIPTVEYIGQGYVGGVYRCYLPLVVSIPWYQVVARPDGELPKLRKLPFDEGDKIHQDLPEIRRYVIDWSGDPPHSIALPW
ncbi:uncharacterized protein LAESUDRAFT_520969 [Laetiporus sulphureus 93-53]|uniref:F-box domain-containing protein n=1 Tax=Laetiporus sulphureus 93-53 TaxID=1314785 RepID=A0A165G3S0_9APHY|nr:uncharacterized protein LAESUDRAFT_520969 [Laetiporus sulphureus 93-53]KZT09787.1 hypothetical protein LAESUDRAFT_520969 [Laetiporus sulphureus 93-53]